MTQRWYSDVGIMAVNTTPFAIFTTLALLLYSLYSIFVSHYFSPLRSLPCPQQGHPLKRLHKEPTPYDLEKWSLTVPNEGFIRYYGVLNSERLLITSSDGIRELLAVKTNAFGKGRLRSLVFEALMGNGLLTVEGEAHKTQRKVLQPAFKFQVVQRLSTTSWKVACDLTRRMKRDINREEAASGALDVQEYVSRAALDLVGLATGLHFNAISDCSPDNKLYHVFREAMKPTKGKRLSIILALILPRKVWQHIPFIGWSATHFFTNFMDSAYQRVLISQNWPEKKTTRGSGASEASNILEAMLSTTPLPMKNALEQCRTILVAGHETTTTVVACGLYELSKPENRVFQVALREEIRSHLPSPEDSSLPDFIDFSTLPLLTATCNEILRLYPASGVTTRTSLQTIDLLSQQIPKGTTINISHGGINKSQDRWGSDAERFNPSRWMNINSTSDNQESKDSSLEGEMRGRKQYDFMTFSQGSRVCIGQNFARQEIAAMIAAVIGRFHLELEKAGTLSWHVVLKFDMGCWIRLREVEGW